MAATGAVFICTPDLDSDNTAKGAKGGCAGVLDTATSYGISYSGNTATDGSSDLFWTGKTCGSGIPLAISPTALWQQLALPCVPSASPASVANVLGNSPTANLRSAIYGSRWILYGRNSANSGNVALSTVDLLASGAGLWVFSYDAPVSGRLTVEGTATPVQAGQTGCQSANGCFVASVATSAAGARMIGNPFPYGVDWSQVRVRVNGTTLYTPSEAQATNILSSQIWIWNGNTYDTWDDVTDPGNLQYFKAFFIKVLQGGVGQTSELLIPAQQSTLSARPAGERPWYLAWLDALIPCAAAAEGDPWQIRLRVENPKTGAKARALLGQRSTAETGYDPADLSAMASFASPYLTLVFPQPGWGARKGDYASDFRPAVGWPDTWTLELRTDPVGAKAVLRWEGSPAILARSRLIDGQTGRVIDPTNPAYVNGYPLTLTAKVRRLTWQYLGH